MASIKKQLCIHCHTLFVPDYRNSKRQRFCHLPECRIASKAASQKRWLAENPDHFKGPDNVFCV
jgi:predicted RNA-binding Zn ribbon-like protein